MDDEDRAGAIAAIVAVALMTGAWIWSPPSWASADSQGFEQASQQALELQTSGQPLLWRGDDGIQAAITPSNAFRDGSGRWCRPYSVVRDDAAPPPGQSVSCRDEAGQWSIAAVGTAPATVLIAQVN